MRSHPGSGAAAGQSPSRARSGRFYAERPGGALRSLESILAVAGRRGVATSGSGSGGSATPLAATRFHHPRGRTGSMGGAPQHGSRRRRRS